MTKEWTSFAQVQAAVSPVDFMDDEVRGMSDEEELSRIAQASGYGEVLFDYNDDARELGLIDE